ncbi:Alpha/Beta hydrolase protein [Plectosphaerella plurivora]|uniref:Alpha/Beta hydrolase protein n=1 Tax=Plectosphaerella plurivora TaxID=936078 RepID=A0A9P8V2U0_9PEZI|nr:Alpha/Beta hydrolase protein [Plectosphaerella plurivora]
MDVSTTTSILRSWKHFASVRWRPILDALWYGRYLPWSLRWRLLAFQPLHSIGSLVFFSYIFHRPFEVDYIPVGPDRELRVLVFNRRRNASDDKRDDDAGRPRPLHVDAHAGGFMAGYPEADVQWCELVAQRTGAVVVSVSYRLAPVHPFPAAIDDVDAIITWLQQNAAERYGADPNLMTTSGFSAGGNLMLACTQSPACHAPAPTAIKGYVGFYPVLDLIKAPWEKPRSKDLPSYDPLSFLEKLYDSYAAPTKTTSRDNARLNPGLAPLETLPKKMLIFMPRIDILPAEIMKFQERIEREAKERGEAGRVLDVLDVKDAFHGYLEVPNIVVPWHKKMEVFDKGINLLQDVHAEHGWKWTRSGGG